MSWDVHQSQMVVESTLRSRPTTGGVDKKLQYYDTTSQEGGQTPRVGPN